MTAAETSATLICAAWKPFERNTLRGFADLWLRTARLNIKGCAVHEKNGRRWVQLPARPQLDKDRNLVRDDAAKVFLEKMPSTAELMPKREFQEVNALLDGNSGSSP